MKEKILKMTCVFMLALVVMAYGSVVFAAPTTNTTQTVSEEEIQSMVDTKVDQAVSTAVANMNQANAESEEETETSNGVGMVAAALATGLGCIGAGIAVAVVASSAVGAISENPSLLGKTIIFAGLAEGIAIYGLIIAIMILNKI